MSAITVASPSVRVRELRDVMNNSRAEEEVSSVTDICPIFS
ncbi:MAG: hypothetical protein AAF217_11150 [Pseudomonadota bacterium]